MKKVVFLFFSLLGFLYALEFKVASYNVENLFDLNYDGTEYKEYIPNTKYWNKKAFENKLKNITKVITELDADILALQEIESKTAFDSLKKKTSYNYGVFVKKRTSSVGVGVFSKFPILEYKNIDIDKYDKYSRDILKVKIKIENESLFIYNNHWRSKRAPESKRIKYALALKKDIETLTDDQDYIILGDLNSNYNEFVTFKYDKNLNDSFDITGINQILNTTLMGNLLKKEYFFKADKQDISHYNLWLELSKENRFSSKFKKQNNTPDNILVSDELFDQKGISYINNSFEVFKPSYLYKNRINRWNIYKAKGFSDHLPVFAYFSTKKQNFDIKRRSKNFTKIDQLYSIQNLNEPIILKDLVVLYKANKLALVKQLNNRAIAIYKPPKSLKTGRKYTLKINKLDSYFGLKEIKDVKILDEQRYFDYKKYYLDGGSVDLFDLKNQNEVVSNLEGVYNNGYLYYKDYKNNQKKIKIYFKKGIKKPKNDQKLLITSGHLGIYKSNIQIIIYSLDDLKVY